MAIFHGYVSLPEGLYLFISTVTCGLNLANCGERHHFSAPCSSGNRCSSKESLGPRSRTSCTYVAEHVIITIDLVKYDHTFIMLSYKIMNYINMILQ
jgi:hypothetical protein